MDTQLDLRPAARRLASIVEAVPDDALGRPTPCARFTVGDLLDHVGAFALAFKAAAVKQPLGGAPEADAANLGDDWRERIPCDLLAMGEAWADPAAWTGMTAAGGVDLPGDLAGATALDELVLHAWDLARATGQLSDYDDPEVESVLRTVGFFRDSGAEGIFGPPVAVPDDASLLDRTLGLSGRDPAWAPTT